MSVCEYSGELGHTSDYNVMRRKAKCPKCGQLVRITVPNKNTGKVKYSKHTAIIETYKFPDFSPQVISTSADKSYVSEDGHTGHNED